MNTAGMLVIGRSFGITIFELFKVHFYVTSGGQCLAGSMGSPIWSDCLNFLGVEFQGVCAAVSSPSLGSCKPPDGFQVSAGAGLVVGEVPSLVVFGPT